ncbi:FAD-binding protein, partial [Acinetobacter baumannii]|nr:FAD-binding protein [Acinetobacter baumannii]
MINKDIYQALQQLIPNEKIKVDEPLKRYTYTKTGGNADFYITPTKNEEVQAVVKYAYQNEIPVTYLGNGSNIIIREGGIRGIVISLLSLDHIEVSDDCLLYT